MECAVFHVLSNDTRALAVLHDQVEGKVLDEEVGVVTQRLAIERLQEVNGGCTTVGRPPFPYFKD